MCPRTSLGAICSDLWLVVMYWRGNSGVDSILATLYMNQWYTLLECAFHRSTVNTLSFRAFLRMPVEIASYCSMMQAF